MDTESKCYAIIHCQLADLGYTTSFINCSLKAFIKMWNKNASISDTISMCICERKCDNGYGIKEMTTFELLTVCHFP